MGFCKATTKSGSPCKNNALPNSDYCHIPFHQTGVKQNVYRRMWNLICNHKKLSTVVGIFITLLPILAVVSDSIQVYSFFEQDNKKDLREATAPILKSQDLNQQETKKSLGEIHNLLIQQYKIKRDSLKKMYPLGYALFFADDTEVHSFNDVSTLPRNFNIDWSQVKVYLGSSDIQFEIPYLRFEKGSMNIKGKTWTHAESTEMAVAVFTNPWFQLTLGILLKGKDYEGKDYIVGIIGARAVER